ncbi:MAG: nitrous oxide reductase accessory protein NosL [Deltaproteobacteria bacterium]|jgi:copper chaperone NosL
MSFRYAVAGILVFLLALASGIQAAPVDQPPADSRCAVCGMFIAKYPNWFSQVRHTDGTIKWFDGPKDMLTYYFNTDQFDSQTQGSFQEIWVKDYYSLNWLDGRKAIYVTGSDVNGPMGHEFIPFASKEAAEAFMKDHKGKQILTFQEITPEQVQAMRSGHMMKGR